MQIDYKLAAMLGKAAEIGAIKALTHVGHLKPYISMSEAGRRAGKTQVKKWMDSGQLKFEQSDSFMTIIIDRVSFESLNSGVELIKHIDINGN